MQGSEETKRFSFTFWLSILLHLCILLFFYFFMRDQIPKTMQHEKQQNYIQSYVYNKQPPKTVYHERQSVKKNVQTKAAPQKAAIKIPTTASKSATLNDGQVSAEAIMASSFKVLDQMQEKKITESSASEEEPIYLIGQENGVSDPLIIMMAKALSLNFAFPQKEGELGMRGVVLIGFVLTPNGQFTEVRVERSSHIDAFDQAALYAANSAPAIKGVERFIDSPKHFVVGFIFK